jgi:hypothetical protein
MGDHRLGPSRMPPGERAHARRQLVEIERLDQVVVGAGVQPGDPIGDGVAAVRISTGRRSPRRRIAVSTPSPSRRGRPRSSSSRSCTLSASAASAAWPSCTQSTVKPSCFNPSRTLAAIIRSSSASSRRMSSQPIDGAAGRPGREGDAV